MEAFIYFLAFIMGSFLGSFCTLAVYRIPLKQDITHERSYCPKCNHSLGALDLIPIFSYIFLGGKCRYCKEKVRIRYLLLEIFFGLTYMLFIMSLNLNLLTINLNDLAYILFGTLYLVTLFLIAGIDKEYKNIHKSVLIFGVISVICYIVYLYVVQGYVLYDNIYRYVIYAIILLMFMLIESLYKKQKNKASYVLQILCLFIFMLLFTGRPVMFLTTICTLLTVAIMNVVKIKKQKKEEKLPIGFYLCVYNILFLLIQNFIQN